MKELITLCGDDCMQCPRYNASTEEQLKKVAELWHRVGWRDTVLPPEEMRCSGCSSHKQCTYGLLECTREHGVERCAGCGEFSCGKINEVLRRSKEYQERCERVCSPEEYRALERAFFNKEENLRRKG